MSTIEPFTAKDVCIALGGISRSRVHHWAQLPPFLNKTTHERSARRYSKADLLTFAVLQTLESDFGVKSGKLAHASVAAYHYFNTPSQTISYAEWVFIPLDDGEAYRLQAQTIQSLGWIINVTKVRECIDTYLGVKPPQQELPLIASLKSG